MSAEGRRTDRHDDLPANESVAELQVFGSHSGPMVDHALRYAELGWPVLPLVPGTKLPLTRHGVHDATIDRSRITAWWRSQPRANIGLACGVAFEVDDFDVRVSTSGQVVYSARDAISRLNRMRLLGTNAGMAITRHGGWQMLFPPAGIGVRHFRHAAVDLIGKGGYVVAPPSIVPPDEGIRGPGRYSWQRPPALGDPGVAPADWDAWERVLEPPARSSSGERSSHASASGLVRIVRWAPIGGRNNALFWALCRAMEQGLATGEIAEAAQLNGLPAAEVEATYASALRTTGACHV